MNWQNLKRYAIPAVIALSYIALLVYTSNDIGVTRDENVYLSCAEKIANSSISFFEKFNCNTEHLPFIKSFNGIIFMISRYFFDITTSLRFGTYLIAGIFLFLFYLIIRKDFGEYAALAAAGVLFFMPRVFYHAHLLALELPVMAAFFLASRAFLGALEEKSWKSSLIFAFSLAFLMLNKITGYVIFPVFALFLVYRFFFSEKIYSSLEIKGKKIPSFVIAGVIALLLFFALHPLIWASPGKIISQWGFGLARAGGGAAVEDNILVLGNYVSSKSFFSILYAPSILFTTLSSLLAIFSIAGIFLMIKRIKTKEIYKLYLLSFALPFIYFASPFYHKYDGERLFLLIYPFLALFAGFSISAMANKLSEKFSSKQKIIKICILLIVLLAGAYSLWQSHPFESSYFNAFVGGSKGVSENVLFDTTYWQDEAVYTLDFINRLPDNSSVGFIGYPAAYMWYQYIGKIKPGIKIVPQGDVNYFAINLKQTYLYALSPEPYRNQLPADTPWEIYNSGKHVFNVTNSEGVDLIRIFRMK